MIDALIITSKGDITSDFVVRKLKAKQVSFYRFNTEEIGVSVFLELNFTNNTFLLNDIYLNKVIDLTAVKSVYFRRPEIPEIEIEGLSFSETQFVKGELVYTLEGIYKILDKSYWISPLYSIRQTENKIYQLNIAREIGFRIPNTIISNKASSAIKFFHANMGGCIIKPIKCGLVEEAEKSKVIFANELKTIEGKDLQVELCPILLQEKIEKKGDIRVTLVGDTVFSAFIDSQSTQETEIDWRKGTTILEHRKIDLPPNITEMCIQLLKRLNLRFGAIDFVLDSNSDYIFLEINPNGQWAWIEHRLGYDISGAIVNLLINENF